MNISVAVCTRNNCASLLKTLESLRTVQIDLPGELLLVDNGSTDGTWDTLRSYAHPILEVRRIKEERRGLCFARNRVLAEAQGDVILFTDDDVRVPAAWVRSVSEPILAGKASGVVGGIVLASHLVRSWMTWEHRAWLAETEALNPEDPGWLVGANMAIAREVLTRVPAFDAELDPGRLGGWGDTLFSWQMREAGFRLRGAFDHPAEHHVAESRLSHRAFVKAAQVQGRCRAYVDYHWHHRAGPSRRQILRTLLDLAKIRLRRPTLRARSDEMTELHLVANLATARQWMVERRRARRYEKHGLRVLH